MIPPDSNLAGFFHAFSPDKALRLSSDAEWLRLYLQRFGELGWSNPGSAELLQLLAGIFLRIDRSDKYRELLAAQVGAEIVAQIGAKDPVWADILSAALYLLQDQERLGAAEQRTRNGSGLRWWRACTDCWEWRG